MSWYRDTAVLGAPGLFFWTGSLIGGFLTDTRLSYSGEYRVVSVDSVQEWYVGLYYVLTSGLDRCCTSGSGLGRCRSGLDSLGLPHRYRLSYSGKYQSVSVVSGRERSHSVVQ